MLGLVQALRPARRDTRPASFSLVSFTPIFCKCRRATSSSSFFGKTIDADFVGVLVLPEIELREDLVGERVRHDEARMAGGAAEIHEAAFGEQENLVAVRESVFVDLRLDVRALDVLGVRSSGRPEFRYRNGRCCRRSPGLSSCSMCSSVMTSTLPVVVT